MEIPYTVTERPKYTFSDRNDSGITLYAAKWMRYIEFLAEKPCSSIKKMYNKHGNEFMADSKHIYMMQRWLLGLSYFINPSGTAHTPWTYDHVTDYYEMDTIFWTMLRHYLTEYTDITLSHNNNTILLVEAVRTMTVPKKVIDIWYGGEKAVYVKRDSSGVKKICKFCVTETLRGEYWDELIDVELTEGRFVCDECGSDIG